MGSANGEGETANVEGKAGESSDKGVMEQNGEKMNDEDLKKEANNENVSDGCVDEAEDADEVPLMDNMLWSSNKIKKYITPELELDYVCTVSQGHHSCQPMQLSEALNHPGGDVHLQTPIEFAIYRHISTVLGKLDQRDFALIDSIRSLILENRDNPDLTDAGALGNLILGSYISNCHAHPKLSTRLMPSEEALRAAVLHRLNRCQLAISSMEASGRRPICFKLRPTRDAVKEVSNMNDDEFERWERFFEDAEILAEELRAKLVHKTDNFIHVRALHIGDSGAALLNSLTKTVLITGDSTKEIMELVRRTIFSSKIKTIHVCLGTDDLRRYVDPEQIAHSILDVLDILAESRANTLVVPPAYNASRNGGFVRLINCLACAFGLPYTTLGTGSGGGGGAFSRGKVRRAPRTAEAALVHNLRALPEITRIGRGPNKITVDNNGELTMEGVRQTVMHLKHVYNSGCRIFYPGEGDQTVVIREPLLQPLVRKERPPKQQIPKRRFIEQKLPDGSSVFLHSAARKRCKRGSGALSTSCVSREVAQVNAAPVAAAAAKNGSLESRHGMFSASLACDEGATYDGYRDQLLFGQGTSEAGYDYYSSCYAYNMPTLASGSELMNGKGDMGGNVYSNFYRYPDSFHGDIPPLTNASTSTLPTSTTAVFNPHRTMGFISDDNPYPPMSADRSDHYLDASTSTDGPEFSPLSAVSTLSKEEVVKRKPLVKTPPLLSSMPYVAARKGRQLGEMQWGDLENVGDMNWLAMASDEHRRRVTLLPERHHQYSAMNSGVGGGLPSSRASWLLDSSISSSGPPKEGKQKKRQIVDVQPKVGSTSYARHSYPLGEGHFLLPTPPPSANFCENDVRFYGVPHDMMLGARRPSGGVHMGLPKPPPPLPHRFYP